MCCAVLEQWHVQIHDIPTPPGRHGGVGALIGSPMAACSIGQVQYMYLPIKGSDTTFCRCELPEEPTWTLELSLAKTRWSELFFSR